MSQAPIDSTGVSRGSLKSYLTGFVLSLILTAIPFALVMSGALSSSATLAGIFSAGIVQILVHLHYFLHLDTSSAARWNVLAMIFTLLIMALFVGGTLWIMLPELPNDVRMPERIKNYLLVAKPGIVFGNLISAAAGFFLASKGRVDGVALPATLIGISLVVASGCVFNNCVDRKIDRKMIRTRNRALAKGLISLKIAVSYATILGIAGMALLCAATNLLAVVIVLAGLVIYVGVYSLYMKRNSVYSALIGSLAGATPPLAGYCAVTGRFDMGAVILLSIFSLWQMPHCYAIAVFRFDDYTAAAIPVLPVKQGTAAAKKHIVGYILAFMAATLMLTFGGTPVTAPLQWRPCWACPGCIWPGRATRHPMSGSGPRSFLSSPF